MAKVTKRVLKGIVKECLVEILSEGISSDELIGAKQSTRLSGMNLKEKRQKKPRPAIDNVTFNTAINEATSAMTNDPVMSAIFADTARTTLQNQYGAEGNRNMVDVTNADNATKLVANSDLEDLFEGSNNWANLAFSEKESK
jgi:hypothetical protein